MFLAPFYSQFRTTLNAQRQRWLNRDRAAALIATIKQQRELEQSLLRVAIVGCILAYQVWSVLRSGASDPTESEVVNVTIGFLAFSILLTLRIIEAPHGSAQRRFLGMVCDNLVATYFLFRTGEHGAAIIFVYLFITVGNGYRFGRLYLHVCQIMGFVGLVVLFWAAPFWSHYVWFGIGLLVMQVVIPIYAGMNFQRVKRADEAKGRFLANMSHEMRTPLNGVIAMADVLRETSLSESQREIVDTLSTSANLLLAQIEDVLDMAKIEAGRVQIECRPFDLGKLLTSTVKVVLPQARYKGLAINTELAPDAARWFQGDAHHLRQVLLNLLANAIKFTEHGAVTLRVAVIENSEVDAKIRIEVQDTGIGISPAKQAAIFEPFTQADDSITRVYGGTGLGTTIARQLVRSMRGEIGVSSVLGEGSTFWIELRLPFGEPAGIDLTTEIASTSKVSVAALVAQQPTKITKIRGARVLVAEDNPTNQRVTELILESAGHRATIVDNGEAALDALERGNFDIALFDLSMPIVSGLEALKLYQFTTPNPIPVLILSANVTTDIVADCQRAGCAEFIPKPVRPTALLEAIERHLAANVKEAVAFVPTPGADERPALTVIGTPIVDRSVLRDLDRLSSDPTFVERLVRGFRADSARLVKSMSDALAARRYDDVQETAHALKGGAGSVGATQLVRLAVRFEKANHELLRRNAAAWMAELAHAANAALAALDQHVEDRRRRSGGETS